MPAFVAGIVRDPPDFHVFADSRYCQLPWTERMIDSSNRALSDKFWNLLASPLVAISMSPNQVTITGLVLVLANCAAYVWHRNSFWFGLGLALSFAFDGLDGAVARRTGKTSKFGGYLDAVTDRYQEAAVLFTIAWVTGWWAVSFLALFGSLLTSYNKARTALEISIDNKNWPDLMERLERIIVLCGALMLDPFVTLPHLPSMLYLGLLAVALFSNLTAFQRFLRARARICEADRR
jgi:phosphatidylglycerophosphate synthase